MNSNIEILKNQIKEYNIPKHIAIILDGNGTWAKKRGFERNVGHRHGARTLVEICKYAREIGVQYLTVYAFSTENWNRPKKEVNYLMRLLEVFLREQKKNIKKGNIQLKIIGTRSNLTDKQIITLMKNCIFKIKKTKKKHPPKKWWQIFQNTLLFKNIRIEKK